MRLDPEQTRKLLDLLQHNEATLRQMAEGEKEAQTRALHQVYTMIFESHRKHESAEFRWAERQVPWVQDEKPLTWSCELSPNRAKIFCRDYWFWEVCIDRRNPGGPGYNRFLHLEEAVAWAEEQLSLAVRGGRASRTRGSAGRGRQRQPAEDGPDSVQDRAERARAGAGHLSSGHRVRDGAGQFQDHGAVVWR